MRLMHIDPAGPPRIRDITDLDATVEFYVRALGGEQATYPGGRRRSHVDAAGSPGFCYHRVRPDSGRCASRRPA
jgi:hypothetical protein